MLSRSAHSLADAAQPFLQHSPKVRHHKATHEALHSITCHICPSQDDTQHGAHTSANSPETPCHRADQTQATHSQRCRTVAYLPTRPCQLPNRCAPKLRERVSKPRDQTIPFHPPSTKVVFRRHPQIQQVLHNWRAAHHQWVPDHPPPCACQHLHTSHYPHLFHGDIATPLSELLPDQHCLKFSGKSTLFPKASQLHHTALAQTQSATTTTPCRRPYPYHLSQSPDPTAPCLRRPPH